MHTENSIILGLPNILSQHTIKQLNSFKQFNFLGLYSSGMLYSVGW